MDSVERDRPGPIEAPGGLSGEPGRRGGHGRLKAPRRGGDALFGRRPRLAGAPRPGRGKARGRRRPLALGESPEPEEPLEPCDHRDQRPPVRLLRIGGPGRRQRGPRRGGAAHPGRGAGAVAGADRHTGEPLLRHTGGQAAHRAHAEARAGAGGPPARRRRGHGRRAPRHPRGRKGGRRAGPARQGAQPPVRPAFPQHVQPDRGAQPPAQHAQRPFGRHRGHRRRRQADPHQPGAGPADPPGEVRPALPGPPHEDHPGQDHLGRLRPRDRHRRDRHPQP